MIFQKLAALVAMNVNINITIQDAGNGKLEIGLFPTTSTKDPKGLIAKSLVGTPEELDAGLPAVLEQYTRANLSLAEQLGNIEKEAEQAASALKSKSASATVKPTQLSSKKPASQKRTCELDDDMDIEQEDGETSSSDDGTDVSSPRMASADVQPFVL